MTQVEEKRWLSDKLAGLKEKLGDRVESMKAGFGEKAEAAQAKVAELKEKLAAATGAAKEELAAKLEAVKAKIAAFKVSLILGLLLLILCNALKADAEGEDAEPEEVGLGRRMVWGLGS